MYQPLQCCEPSLFRPGLCHVSRVRVISYIRTYLRIILSPRFSQLIVLDPDLLHITTGSDIYGCGYQITIVYILNLILISFCGCGKR